MREALFPLLGIDTWIEFWWIVLGLGAQAAFSARFVVQWIASERAGRSYIPVAFWWLSIVGGVTLFAYAVHRHDIVFMLGQSMGIVVYARNLALIYRGRHDADAGGAASRR